jgi:hypothetical protein
MRENHPNSHEFGYGNASRRCLSGLACSEAVKELGQAPSRPLIAQSFRRFRSEPVPFFHSLSGSGVPGATFAGTPASLCPGLACSRPVGAKNGKCPPEGRSDRFTQGLGCECFSDCGTGQRATNGTHRQVAAPTTGCGSRWNRRRACSLKWLISSGFAPPSLLSDFLGGVYFPCLRGLEQWSLAPLRREAASRCLTLN